MFCLFVLFIACPLSDCLAESLPVFFFSFYCYIPGVYHSAWHMIGSQRVSVECVNQDSSAVVSLDFLCLPDEGKVEPHCFNLYHLPDY